jgi:hypothetical protein
MIQNQNVVKVKFCMQNHKPNNQSASVERTRKKSRVMDTEKTAEKRNPLAAQSAPPVIFIRPMSILLSGFYIAFYVCTVGLSYQRCLSVCLWHKGRLSTQV